MNSYSYFKFLKEYKLIGLLLVAFIVRTFFLLTTDNYLDHDTPCRLEDTIRFIKHFDWFPRATWPPLPTWLGGFGAYITGEFVWTPRVMAYLFSIATVIPLYKFNDELFGDKTALFTTILYIMSPSIGYFSVITLSEPYFFFFVLLCLLCFFQYMKWKNISYLYLMSLSMGLGMLVRFEMWVMALLFIIGVGLVAKEKKLMLPPFLVATFVAMFVFSFTYIRQGDPLYGVLYHTWETPAIYKLYPKTLYQRIVAIMPAFAFLSFFGLIPILFKRYTEDKRILLYRIFTAIIFLLPLYKVITDTLMDNFRYFLISDILFLPFFIKFFLQIEKSIQKYTPKFIIFAIEVFISLNKKTKNCIYRLWSAILKFSVTGMFIFLFIKNYQTIIHERYPAPHIEEGLKKTALFVKDNIGRSKKIFLDKSPGGSSQYGWTAYADRTPWDDVTCYVFDHTWSPDAVTDESSFIRDCILKKNSRIFVLFNNGMISKFLRENPDYFSSLGFYSKELFEFDGYQVIEIFQKKEES